MSLIPDGASTLAVVGDTHFAWVALRRPYKALAGWNRLNGMVPEVAVLAHIGDMVEGTKQAVLKGGTPTAIADQEALAQAWWTEFANATVKKAMPGNHDLDRAADGSGTVAQWEAAWGEPAGAVIDTPSFRLITLTDSGTASPLSTTPQQTAFEAAVVAAAPKPVVVLHHFALRGSHGEFNQQGVHGSQNDTTVSPYLGCVTAGTDAFIKACAGRQSNLVATVHGHTHPYYDVVGMARAIDVGGRNLYTFNVSALTYVNGGSGTAGFHPLVFTLLTFTDDAIELRLRDVGAGVYLSRTGAARVERFPY